MKITFIGHAAILVETKGVTILSDPWWSGPCFGAQWWNYPAAAIDNLQDKQIDYIYVSHGHHDHLHPGTLKTLSRQAKVLVSSTGDLAPTIRELGFTVIEVAPDQEIELSQQVRARLMPTHNDDTLLAISDGEEVCINLNDALHSAPRTIQDKFIAELKRCYPRIDYVFCGYGVASHFPNCYRVPGKNGPATAGHRQRYFNAQWTYLVDALSPRFAFPFAADVVFLEHDLLWANEPTQNTERPTAALAKDHPQFSGAAIDLAPGFQIEGGRILRDVRRKPVSENGLRGELATQIDRANRYGQVEWTEVQELRTILEANIAAHDSYFSSFPGDYRFLVRFRNSKSGITINRSGGNFSIAAVEDAGKAENDAEVVFTTRLPYLRWSLTTKYGGEIIFVGSGGIFDYARREDVPRALHGELAAMIRKHEQLPRRPKPPANKLIGTAKKLVKKILGMETIDLYDLDRWTVYDQSK